VRPLVQSAGAEAGQQQQGRLLLRTYDIWRPQAASEH